MADENAPSQKTVLGRSKIFTPEVIDDIHMKAELGRYRMRGFSMFKKIPLRPRTFRLEDVLSDATYNTSFRSDGSRLS